MPFSEDAVSIVEQREHNLAEFLEALQAEENPSVIFPQLGRMIDEINKNYDEFDARLLLMRATDHPSETIRVNLDRLPANWHHQLKEGTHPDWELWQLRYLDYSDFDGQMGNANYLMAFMVSTETGLAHVFPEEERGIALRNWDTLLSWHARAQDLLEQTREEGV